MSLVIDTSITLVWFFEDERFYVVDAILSDVADHGAIAPSLWRLEVANALQSAVHRKRIATVFRDASLTDLRALMVNIDLETDLHAWATTLHLAERFNLTLYDATYLELAQRLSLPLATLDQELRSAGGALGVRLLGL